MNSILSVFKQEIIHQTWLRRLMEVKKKPPCNAGGSLALTVIVYLP